MSDDIWVVIPAAGRGARFGGDIPKQYELLRGRTVLERSVACFDGLQGLRGIVIAVSADDTLSRLRHAPDVLVEYVTGGETRGASVSAALDWLAEGPAAADDWVMVHDAARPLLSVNDRDALVAACRADAVGGLLATPVADTLKRGDEDSRVQTTVPRTGLWRAMTPQMFRLGDLRKALATAGLDVTDEASAMEAAGHRPLLVAGSALNVKITTRDDLALAEALS